MLKGLHAIDARDVVPYNPYLSKISRCHLNVEYCGSIRAVKYLYKYMYKGHDRAQLQFKADEVERYMDARYVGPPESCWRLLRLPMHDISHTIVRLAVHEEGLQPERWQQGQEVEASQGPTGSTLTAWLALNAAGEDGGVDSTVFRYAELPEHFAWDRKNLR